MPLLGAQRPQSSLAGKPLATNGQGSGPLQPPVFRDAARTSPNLAPKKTPGGEGNAGFRRSADDHRPQETGNSEPL